ncbi:protein of unknown function DUF81 [Paracidovorax avenae ATCC 19860]|uniref:Probable membrane transporter protein n=1 Tax=Paracidovorax avenae (strain ATCC 19860 / DSM 7227 / CCUG 15838 / JCM 20985 / LMG 2117 / NCPPB 1011) TaxID=643561 RepID=F0QAJ9_PARA1|nr:sulfite exporter TauE/SafE family protein [Paracidovorax avenae]ADX46040.1 protein of unknown function DUF81 [Paracidovorax avenae ATCC 19860]
MVYTLLIITGMVTGFLSGLLGVGGGFLMVPVFIVLLPLQFPLEMATLPQVAVATALAATVPATASAVYAQYKRGALPIAWVKRLAPSAAMGAAVGAVAAGLVHGVWVALVFSLYAAYFGLRMLRGAGASRAAVDASASPQLIQRISPRAIGGMIGMFSATAGVGGASLTIPYLLAQRDSIEMRNAVAAGSAVGLSIALVGAFAFALGPTPEIAAMPGLLGLVCWTAAIAVAVPAAFLAPWGVSVSHRLPTQRLKRAFGLVMLLGAVITVWKVFG